jgi:hypothetical protein
MKMGLITGLLKLPLAPVTGTIAVAEQVRRQAEEEFYDAGKIAAELKDVEARRADGLLTAEEATTLEDELVDRLIEGRSRRTRERT